MVNAEIEHREYDQGLGGLLNRLRRLQSRHIYVGIPQAENSRNSGDIGNAELLYIHTHGVRRRSMINEMDESMRRGLEYSAAYALYIQSHGSPLWHSPPRPVIEPAIEANKATIARRFKEIYSAAASGNNQALEAAITRTGLTAQNIVRAWFTDPRNGWAPNSPATVARKGSDRPLIDSGEMRKAITYVVRSE